jgi:hypothetical protein
MFFFGLELLEKLFRRGLLLAGGGHAFIISNYPRFPGCSVGSPELLVGSAILRPIREIESALPQRPVVEIIADVLRLQFGGSPMPVAVRFRLGRCKVRRA